MPDDTGPQNEPDEPDQRDQRDERGDEGVTSPGLGVVDPDEGDAPEPNEPA